MTYFHNDLNKEQILGVYLDAIYDKLNFKLTRVKNSKLQFEGVDLIYQSKNGPIFIDEKSQLHYINSDLPTFTFELSYLKHQEERKGWLLDRDKITQYYFLITGIFVKSGSNIDSGLKSCKITSVNRIKLIQLLASKGLTPNKLMTYAKEIRHMPQPDKKIVLQEINQKTEGCLVYSNHLSEKPINVMLKLEFLISQGVAKQIHPLIQK
ncbi:hypothetical protein [Winogradskyella sp.]|uniref:hypothetical protein n=1 Tax=Winogradskyella sp. TaxID=1883156 RepID=UPI00261C58D4|nr:hypothetical protein [Winogradskyella sp.]